MNMWNLTGLQYLDLSDINKYQMSHPFPIYENCDNFLADVNCENYRSAFTRKHGIIRCFFENPSTTVRNIQNDFDLQSYDSKPIIRSISPECSPNNSQWYFEVDMVVVPPNLSVFKMNRARLGRALDWMLFEQNALVSLDFSDNEIYSMTGPICNVTQLKHLDLSSNKCSVLSSYVFGFLPNLETLHLGHNRLGESKVWHQSNASDLFSNQTKLTFLNLEDNRITFRFSQRIYSIM